MKSGQTLMLLLVFSAIAIAVATTSAVISIANTQGSSQSELGGLAYSVAESGAENAVIRLLRNPGYTGETLTVGDGQATIIVTGSGPYTITSTGVVGSFSRAVQVIAAYTGGILSVTSWQEIYP